MILVTIGNHVVLHASGSFSTLLVFHDTVALVIDNGIPFCFKKFLIQTKVCKCSDYHSFSTFCSSSGSTHFCPGVKILNVQTKILSVLYPVGNLLLARSNKEYSAFALLSQSLSNAKTCVCFSCTSSIGKQVALTVSMFTVCMFLSEELSFSLQYVFLLLRQEIRQSLLYVLHIAHLHFDRLGFHLSLVLLFKRFFELLFQLLVSIDAAPLSDCMSLTIHFVRSVPIVFNESVNIIITKTYHFQLLAFLGKHGSFPLVELVDTLLDLQDSTVKVHLYQLRQHFYLLWCKVELIERSQGNLGIALPCLLPSVPEVFLLLLVDSSFLL